MPGAAGVGLQGSSLIAAVILLTAVWKAVVAKAWNLGGTVILSIIFCVCGCFFCFPVLIQPFSLMVSQAGQV